jgi:hypothetical protein
MGVGNFDSSVNSWIPVSANIYNVYHNISRVLPINSYYVAAFISGFSTLSSSFDLTINNRAYDINQRMLAISFYCMSNPSLVTITISYIIYPVIHPVLNFYY